jgi:hypothetical protein
LKEKSFKITEVTMKRLFILFLLVPFAVLAVSATAVGVDKVKALVPVPMGIIDLVWINVQTNTVSWDFNRIDRNANNPPFPPVSFPEYYEPSQPHNRYYQRIRYRVRGLLWPASNWEVSIVGAGDPSPACGILLSDIEYGDAAAGVWTPITNVPQVLANGSGDVGWQNIYQDYRVKLDGDETSTEGSSTDIIYIIQIL